MTLSKNISYAKPRNHAIDIMKGLTILLVIVGHEQRLPQWVIDSIYSFHMPLFFIVAGYFYKPSTEYTKRIAKDTKRLILPYLAVMLVVTAYIFIVHIVFKPGGDIVFWQSLWACLYPTNLRHHLDVARSVPVWFLLALFWCRQIYNFIYCSFKRTRYVWIIIISVGILLFNDFIRIDLPLAFSQGCSAMIFYFGGGMYRIVISKQSDPKFLSILNSFLFFFVVLAIWIFTVANSSLDIMTLKYTPYFMVIVGAFSGTFIVYRISKWLYIYNSPSLVIRFLEWAGINSMTILCVHSVFRTIPIMAIASSWNVSLSLLLNISLCCGCSYLCGKSRMLRSLLQIKQ